MAQSIFYEIYELLLDHFGHQNWWPADTPFEMLVGAVLTQNTNWKNVDKALANLKAADLLSFEGLHSLDPERLAELIRPSGYYNLKAKRLQNLLQMIEDEYAGDLINLLEDNPDNSRMMLLQVKGIGPETADSILLYAGGHPLFVVDAYTHRVFSRHNLIEEESRYEDIQERFMDNLSNDSQLFSEYHALIVKVAKIYCKKKNPLCAKCPLRDIE